MRHFRRKRKDLVIFIYDYCQNLEEVDLPFVSRGALRQQGIIDLSKAKKAIEDSKFPRLLRLMLEKHRLRQENGSQERRLKQAFALSD